MRTLLFGLVVLFAQSAFGGMVGVDHHEEYDLLAQHNLYGDYATSIMYPYYRSVGQDLPGYSIRRVFDHEFRHIAGQNHSLNADTYVLGPTGGKLGNPEFGTGATVSYSFVLPGTESLWGLTTSIFDLFPQGGEQEIKETFDAISSIADLNFIQVVDFGTPIGTPFFNGDIRIMAASLGTTGPLAMGLYPNGPYGSNGDYAQLVVFNADVLWNVGTPALEPSIGDINFLIDTYGARALPNVAVPEANVMVLITIGAAPVLILSRLHRRRMN